MRINFCSGQSLAQEKILDDFIPLLKDDCQDEVDIQNNCSGTTLQQYSALGVPVQYQNDGSLLYLLSPVVSPPPAEKVKRWLSTGTKVVASSFII